MTLVVETGGCALTANAYIDLLYANQYHLDRGNTAWADATDSAKEIAIIKATTFIDSRYGQRWKGRKQYPLNRSRTWPRVPDMAAAPPALVAIGLWARDEEFTFGANEVPEPVRQATAEAAVRALSKELIPDLDRGGQIVSQSVSLGGISRSTTYAPGAPAATTFGLIDGILQPVLARGANLRNVQRA